MDNKNLPMQALITRSFRRTICIQINPEKGVIVRAPRFMSDSRIEKFLKEKQNWIEKTLKKVRQKTAKKPVFKFELGEKFPYLGSLQSLPVYKKDDVISWYKSEALKFLRERTDFYTKILSEKLRQPSAKKFTILYSLFAPNFTPKISQITPLQIRIRSYRSRWGTCSAHNQITYNWRIIMAPIEVIDYLIIHELCHIVRKNHSKKFYSLVESLNPNYKQNRKWLKENSHLLSI